MSSLEINLSILTEELDRLNNVMSNKEDYKNLAKKLTGILQKSYELQGAKDWDRMLYGAINDISRLLKTDPAFESAVINELGHRDYKIAEDFLKGRKSSHYLGDAFRRSPKDIFIKDFNKYLFTILRAVLYAIESLV